MVGGLVALAFGANHWASRILERDRALQLAEKGQFAEAVPLLEKILQDRPADKEVLEHLVGAKIMAGHPFSEVMPYLSRLIELNPNDVTALKVRMKIWQEFQKHDQAVEDGQRILELQAEDHEIRYEVARQLRQAGRFPEAERECRLCLEAAPAKRTELLFLLAQILHDRLDVPGAEKVLAQLLQEKPAFAPGLLLRGILAFEANDLDRAIPLLRQGRTSDPALRETASYYLSMALARTGQPEESKRMLEEMERLHRAERLRVDSLQEPNNVKLQMEAAEALLEVDRGEDALPLLQAILARDPNHSGAHRLLAAFFEKTGQPAQAAAHRARAAAAR
jgi:predicted Zn-dependent protease